jgi:hypothetical protein
MKCNENKNKHNQCEKSTTKKKNNIVKKNKAQASFYIFSIILNPKQRLHLPRRWLLFKNPKLEVHACLSTIVTYG